MAVGILVSGMGTLTMLAVAARLSGPDTFAVFATWWIAATLVAFPLGVFEVLLARFVVSEQARGQDNRNSVGTVIGRAGAPVLVVATAIVGLDGLLGARYFDARSGVGALAGVFLVVAFGQVLQRGLATGRDDFSAVRRQLVADGLARALLVAAAAWWLPEEPSALAAAVCLAGAFSLGVTHPKVRGWTARPTWTAVDLAQGTTLLLLAGSVGPILINNAAVPWLSSQGATALTVGAFSGVLTLSRIPVQLSSAVFGPLLNRISRIVEQGDPGEMSRLSRRALLGAVGFAIIFAASFTALGPIALHLFLGSLYDLPIWTFALLGISSALMLVCVVVQASAAAQQAWAGIALSWLLGALGFAVTLFLPGTLISRAALAPLVGSGIALVGLAVVTRRSYYASHAAGQD